MNDADAELLLDGLAFLIAHATEDTEGAAAIAAARDDPLLLPWALASVMEGVLRAVLQEQGTDMAEWARSMQQRFLPQPQSG
jgi:hypothetical protein